MMRLALVALAGCTWVSAGDYADRADADGDGVVLADDCDDTDATIFPGAPELCDTVDQDCDGDAHPAALTGWVGDSPFDLTSAEEVVLTDFDRVEACGGTWTSLLTITPGGAARLVAHGEYEMPSWVAPSDRPWVSVPSGSLAVLDAVAVDVSGREATDAPLVEVIGGELELAELVIEPVGGAPLVRASDATVSVGRLDVQGGSFDGASVELVRSELTVDEGSWTHVTGARAAAALLDDLSTLDCRSCQAHDNASGTAGGAVVVRGNSLLAWTGEATGNSSHGGGGFVWLEDTSRATFRDCILTGNSTVGFGGAVGSGIGSASLDMRFCQVEDNSAAGNGLTGPAELAGAGGGLMAFVLLIEDSSFQRNTAEVGGGDVFGLIGSVERSTFSGSSALAGGSVWFLGSAVFTDVVMSGSEAFDAGGCLVAQAEVWLTRVAFSECSAVRGGAVYVARYEGAPGGQGIFIAPGPTPRMSLADVSFAGNTATETGGAVMLKEAEVYQVTDAGPVLFTGNTAGGVLGGGALYAEWDYELFDTIEPRIRFDAQVVFDDNLAPLGSAVTLVGAAQWENATYPDCSFDQASESVPQNVLTPVLFNFQERDLCSWRRCDGIEGCNP